jgi:hypothetical protein
MRIAKVFSNTAQIRYLPPNYTTIYELTKLSAPELKEAIKSGDIHPNMDRSDAEELVARAKGDSEDEEEVKAPKGNGKSELIKDNVEDAEVEEEGEEFETEDDEPKKKPSETPKGIVRDKPGKSSKDFAIENFGECLGSLGEWCEGLEEKLDDEDHLPQEVLDETKELIKRLQKIVANYK